MTPPSPCHCFNQIRALTSQQPLTQQNATTTGAPAARAGTGDGTDGHGLSRAWVQSSYQVCVRSMVCLLPSKTVGISAALLAKSVSNTEGFKWATCDVKNAVFRSVHCLLFFNVYLYCVASTFPRLLYPLWAGSLRSRKAFPIGYLIGMDIRSY